MGAYHLPPAQVRDPMSILDLGANIGLTVAHFAVIYPNARILGVELDEENAALAARNVAPWSPRVGIRHGAVWTHNGVVRYSARPGEEFGLRIAGGGEERATDRSAPAFALAGLVEQLAGPAGRVDYVKMDVEGAEAELLAAPGWSERVGHIMVEVHEPYTVERCSADLRRLGFVPKVESGHWACVSGSRAT
jgi:FkbM family methyltransferase